MAPGGGTVPLPEGPTMSRAPRAATRVVLIVVGATLAVLAIGAVSLQRHQQDNARADLTAAGAAVAIAVDNWAAMGNTSPAAIIAASTGGKGTLTLRAHAAGTTFQARPVANPARTASVNAGARTITLTSGDAAYRKSPVLLIESPPPGGVAG